MTFCLATMKIKVSETCLLRRAQGIPLRCTRLYLSTNASQNASISVSPYSVYALCPNMSTFFFLETPQGRSQKYHISSLHISRPRSRHGRNNALLDQHARLRAFLERLPRHPLWANGKTEGTLVLLLGLVDVGELCGEVFVVLRGRVTYVSLEGFLVWGATRGGGELW